MKPLLRWIIGPVHDNGFSIIKDSVKSMLNIYKNRFDFIICHNQLNQSQLNFLKSLNVELFNQNDYRNKNIYSNSWKLFPARLSMESHEIVMDNDIILFEPLEEIDEFLNSNSTLLYQGIERNYGYYSKHITHNININSGIYGMPPKFDLEINVKQDLSNYKNYYDEQGLVASALLNWHSYCIIPQTTIPIIKPNYSIENYLNNNLYKGIHFCGINSEHHNQYLKWKYNKKLLL